VRGGRDPLVVRVWTELGAGRITEGPVHSNVKGERVYGYKEGRHIWVNPAWTMAETIVHELLHRVNPKWPEEYVANRTTYVLNRMTDAEVETLYDEYQKRVSKPKRKRRRED
jgi:hypothetical protein